MTKGSAKLIKLVALRRPGVLSDFKKIRSGTDRANVLKLMTGMKTPAQIADKLGGGKFTARYVMAHAYCLRRDCGIGYELTEEGKLLALYPGELSYRDAVTKKRTPPPIVRETEMHAAL